MDKPIIFVDDSGNKLVFSEKTLLVFIDDTGHDLLHDPNVPFFGFGGCACLAEEYQDQIREPWTLVEKAFEKPAFPLHASDIGKKNHTNDKQYDAINNFFSTTQFSRFACVLTDSTLNSTPYNYLNIVTAGLYKRIEAIMKWLPFEKVIYVIEDTEVVDRRVQITKAFSGFVLTDKDNNRTIPMSHFFMPKKTNEPGLIVADFIAHTSGTTVRDKRRGKINKYIDRPDFRNIFLTLNEKYISFMEIDSIDIKSD